MAQAVSTAAGPNWLRGDALVAYPAAMEVMRARIASIRAGTAGELVWFLQHPSLYTSGTSAKPADLVEPQRFDTFDAGRGGQWTYHGPGQLVVYVLLDLTQPHGTVPARDVHAYVAALESWLISAMEIFGVEAGRRTGRVGIWVVDDDGTDKKIASIGVRVTRWVTWHGVSLNISPVLEHFSGIIPCGIRDHGVTSLQALGHDFSIEAVQDALQSCWRSVFGPLNSGVAWDAERLATVR